MVASRRNVFADIQGKVSSMIDVLACSPMELHNDSETGDELLDQTVEAAAHLAAAHPSVGE